MGRGKLNLKKTKEIAEMSLWEINFIPLVSYDYRASLARAGAGP